jgi:hypothetical protein
MAEAEVRKFVEPENTSYSACLQLKYNVLPCGTFLVASSMVETREMLAKRSGIVEAPGTVGCCEMWCCFSGYLAQELEQIKAIKNYEQAKQIASMALQMASQALPQQHVMAQGVVPPSGAVMSV